MGFIINYYILPKQDIEKFANIDDDEFDRLSDSNQLPENLYEKILSDFTNWIYFDEYLNCEDGNKYWSRLFKKQLNIESDLSYRTINKKQFLNIIYLVRNQVLLNAKSMTTDYNDAKILNNYKEEPVDLRNLEKKYPGFIGDDSKDLTYIEKIAANAREFNYKYDMLMIHYDDSMFSQMLDNKWLVTSVDTFEYLLANLVYIYKVFDWENNVIIACGG